MLPFQQSQNPFGQSSGQQPNPFGMQNSQVPNANGQIGASAEQSSQFKFGTQNLNPLQSKPGNPFGQPQAFGSGIFTGGNANVNNTSLQHPGPQGVSSGPLFGQPTSGIQFGAPAITNVTPQFGQSNAVPQQPGTTSLFAQPPPGAQFGSPATIGTASQLGMSSTAPQPSNMSLFTQPIPSSNVSQFGQANPITQNNPPAATPLETTVGESKAQATPGDDTANHSNLISSIKENSVNLYNLTLQEILDRHTMILESNIKEFEKDAEGVFERDLQLIRNKNNFISIQNKIAEENTKLDELNEALDFFEKRLEEVELGDQNEMGRVIEDFESICDRFYKKVESFKDEQDEVLDLVNENYEIIDSIDKKLECLVKLRNIK